MQLNKIRPHFLSNPITLPPYGLRPSTYPLSVRRFKNFIFRFIKQVEGDFGWVGPTKNLRNLITHGDMEMPTKASISWFPIIHIEIYHILLINQLLPDVRQMLPEKVNNQFLQDKTATKASISWFLIFLVIHIEICHIFIVSDQLLPDNVISLSNFYQNKFLAKCFIVY